MFEITSEEIALLDDKDLRSLVALLCEAEVKKSEFSTSTVTWGGDQNAKDGGVDVRVKIDSENFGGGYIPRNSTGFQVKRQDMPRKAILDEMAPGGILRPVIKDLGNECGAYIIVSSKGSVSDSALRDRKAAMKDALSSLDSPPEVDFFDRTRIASWVRNYPGIVLWVRNAIRRPINGWEPFKAWSYPEGGETNEYIVGKGVVLRDRTIRGAADMSLIEGIEYCRALLSAPRSAVRLVGLSGVGKTRFVQALFDKRIGSNALDSAYVVYTNIGNEPVPPPFTLASDLIALDVKAILVIDNCSSELHGRLAALIKERTNSQVSLITIEYDVSDDLPEETDVLELRATSAELVENLLIARFPNLSRINISTVASFSGGNARVAIALANTARRSGSLWKLDDRQLFERLFLQRNPTDRSLLEISQACALVYSFEGENTSSSKDAELHCLGALVDQPARNVFAAVSELIRRDLTQRRGPWRAVLPHC